MTQIKRINAEKSVIIRVIRVQIITFANLQKLFLHKIIQNV